MVLIRLIVLKCLMENVRVFAKYVKSSENVLADHLSRGRMDYFRKESKGQHEDIQTTVPDELIPISKVWIN